MRAEYDVLVLGLGAMGSSALYHVAKRGGRVLGIEQFGIGHDRGSSHGHTRAIRLSYYEDPAYVPLLRRAYELWDELEREAGARLLFETGGLYMGPEGSEVVAGSLRAAKEHGLAHEELGHAELARRFPQFRLGRGWRGVLEPRAGFLLSERIIGTTAELALRHGAEVRTGERVESWEADDRGVRVRTAREVVRARSLVIAAGAWASRVVQAAAVRVRPTRQVLGWVWPRRPELFEVGVLPFWAIDAPGEGMYYGFPMQRASEGGPPGFKIARHVQGRDTDPDSLDRTCVPADESDFRSALERFIPEANGPLLGMRACMYENSPDGHFIIDRHPAHANVLIAAGFSGHGFKFASVVGEMLAEAAMSGSCDGLPRLARLARFAERDPR